MMESWWLFIAPGTPSFSMGQQLLPAAGRWWGGGCGRVAGHLLKDTQTPTEAPTIVRCGGRPERERLCFF